MTFGFFLRAGKFVVHAAFGMGMVFRLFLLTDDLHRIAGGIVPVCRNFRKGACQHIAVAGSVVGMRRPFLFFADQLLTGAVGGVGVTFCFFQRAYGDPGETVLTVDMGFGFFGFADKLPKNTGFIVHMGVGFLMTADQSLQGTFLAVDMFGFAAECFAGHGDSGELQTPEHAKDNRKRKERQCVAETVPNRIAVIQLQ